MSAFALTASAGEITKHVNTLMGTATLWAPEDLGFTHVRDKRPWGAETFPGASMPNAMVQLTPVTKYRSGAGYQYEDTNIYGFAHSAMGHWNMLHVPMLPVTKEGFYRPDSYCSNYSHQNETAKPGYYQVFLNRYKVNAEMTSTLRCGYHRYTFRPQDEKRLLIDITRSNNRPRQYEVKKVGTRAFSGYQDGQGRAYFYAVTNYDIDDVVLEKEFSDPVAVATFKDSKGTKPLEVKVGFSFVSIENAKENLEAEMINKSFDQVRNEADQTWEKVLGHILVSGGTAQQQDMFYTTLYRAFLYPALRSDVNGEYLDEQNKVVKADFRYYTNPSFWDTYRNKLILLGMVTPDVAADIIKSSIDRGEKRGNYMPTYFHGDHASTFISGSWLRGIRDFDLKRAYQLLLRNATVPGRGGRPYLEEYIKQGWIAEKDTFNVPTWNEYKAAVTKTVEYAYDDYATALVAHEVKDKANEKELRKRSMNYKNLFDPSTGFWRGRVADGSWVKEFDPYYPWYAYMYREANAWNSLFFAPHDPYGAVALYPSKQAVDQKLDSLFTEPYREYEADNFSGFIGNYCHGNQPGHSIPYTYYFIDQQPKAQAIINRILSDYYGMGPEKLAYAGMDDCGEMSSWYALNAIGIYTFSPADPQYIVTVPLFDKVTFQLDTTGKTFTIDRQGNGTKIKQILVGGKTLKGWFVNHDDLAQGKTLTIITE